MVIKIGKRGHIIKGEYSPKGEIMIVDDTAKTGGYYIYIWPNNGEKWSDSNQEMIYDLWYENFDKVKRHFESEKWKIKWQNNSTHHNEVQNK